MVSLIIGGGFTWLGVVMFFDRRGLGTWWRRIGFHYYDEHDPSIYRYQRRTRLFRSYYCLVALFGLMLCAIGAAQLV